MTEHPAKQRHARYSNILNTVFGAALGVIGGISFPPPPASSLTPPLINYLFAVVYFGFIAVAILWIIARIDVIASMVLDRRRVLYRYYIVLTTGVAISCSIIVGMSAMLSKHFAIATGGLQIASILTTWSGMLIFIAFWARRFAASERADG